MTKVRKVTFLAVLSALAFTLAAPFMFFAGRATVAKADETPAYLTNAEALYNAFPESDGTGLPLAEYDGQGKITKSGFRLIQAGDNLSGKTIYRKGNYFNQMPPFTTYFITFGQDTTDSVVFNDENVAIPSVVWNGPGMLSFYNTFDDNNIETRIENSHYRTDAGPESLIFMIFTLPEDDRFSNVSEFYSISSSGDQNYQIENNRALYTYESVPASSGTTDSQASDETTEKKPTFFENATDWINDNLGLNMTSAAFGSILLVVAIILIFRRK